MTTAGNGLINRRWQDPLLAPPLAAIGAGAILGAAGELGELPFVIALVVLGVAVGDTARHFGWWHRRHGGGMGLDRRGVGEPMACLEAVSPDSEADVLNLAVARAQRAEDDTAARYGFARCAPEDVIRAKALRVEAEIALMRHRVAQLQHGWQR